MYKKIQFLSFGVKVTQDVVQYHLHHVTYAPTCTKFETATF